MTDLVGNWHYPTAMRFGIGRISELADSCRELGMKRPLLVTDPGLAGLPMVKEAVAANEAAGIPTDVFSDIKPNPIGQNISAGVEAYKAGGHDGVIAFGGGSGLDAGKAVALMVGQTLPIWDFEDVGDNVMRNAEQISANIQKNAEQISANIQANSQRVGDNMKAYLNRNLSK